MSLSETDHSALQFVAVCCITLRCVAVCCGVLQCVALCCSRFKKSAKSGEDPQDALSL